MENQLVNPAEAAPRRNLPRLAETPDHPLPGSDTGWEVVSAQIVAVINLAEALLEIQQDGSVHKVKARTVVSLTEREVGRQALVAFEGGDLTKPIVLGLIKTVENDPKHLALNVDGDKFVITAEREIELRCGEASITLTRAGKVLIKGEYVLTRAKGVNRIKGAAVSIN